MDRTELLTIAIPTYNRAAHLEKCLDSLAEGLDRLPDERKYLVQICVRDNASEDQTQQIVKKYLSRIKNLISIRNPQNSGPDENISRCYEEAKGKYVLALGDDDILLPGAINWILDRILEFDYGIIFMRAYSSNQNNLVSPITVRGKDKVLNGEQAILDLGDRLTFISSMVLNRSAIGNPSEFIGTHLVQTYAAVNVLNKIPLGIMSKQYFVSATRANGGKVNEIGERTMPSIVEVFVQQYLRALKNYENYLILERKIKKRLFFYYFLYELARRGEELTAAELATLSTEFADEFYFRMLLPIVRSKSSLVKTKVLLTIAFIMRVQRGEGLKILNYFLRKQRL